MKLLLLLTLLFSATAFAFDPAPITYKSVGDLNFERQRIGYNHDEINKFIVVSYHQWVEDSTEIVSPKVLLSYKIDGSYYYELSLAVSGANKIGDFLGMAIDGRLATPSNINASIEAGREAKDIAMVAAGYTP